jgi:HlyD family secretion protein
VQTEQSRLRNRETIALQEVVLEAAQRSLGRQQTLRDEGLTNAVQFEEAEDALKVATMRLDALREEARFESQTLEFEIRDRLSRVERQRLVAEDLERRVADLTLRSPVDGLVSRLEVTDRDTVAEGQQIVTIVDLSAFEVEVPVPESYADDVAPGTPAEITYNGRVWAGQVKSIAPEVEGSRVPAIVVFNEEAPEGLKQNQRVSARLILDTRSDVLKVARGPFLEAGGGRSVYVIDDGMARLRPIEVGALSVGEVEITSGLAEGERVIISDTRTFESAETLLIRD